MKWFSICGLLILGLPVYTLRAGDSPPSSLVDKVIEQQRSNESSIQSVLIEGTSKETEYERTGQITTIWQYDFFSFSRSNDLIRVRRKGYEENVARETQKSGDSVRVGEDDDLFYSPVSTVDVNRGQIAQRRLPETPQPYPLRFGYGLIYNAGRGGIVPVSSAWERVKKEGLLTVRQDPDNPRLLLAEVRRDEVRVRCWIDPDRGNLIVRRMSDILGGPSDQRLVLEEDEITPKQFGKTWFLESARRRRYLPYFETKGSPIPSETYLREEQILTVTNFVAGASFKPGELEFSTNSFPRMMVLQDKVGGKTIDLTTGGIIPTNAKTWQLHPTPPKERPVSNQRRLATAIVVVLVMVLTLVVAVRLGRRK